MNDRKTALITGGSSAELVLELRLSWQRQDLIWPLTEFVRNKAIQPMFWMD
jgi:hypothetical protein